MVRRHPFQLRQVDACWILSRWRSGLSGIPADWTSHGQWASGDVCHTFFVSNIFLGYLRIFFLGFSCASFGESEQFHIHHQVRLVDLGEPRAEKPAPSGVVFWRAPRHQGPGPVGIQVDIAETSCGTLWHEMRRHGVEDRVCYTGMKLYLKPR